MAIGSAAWPPFAEREKDGVWRRTGSPALGVLGSQGLSCRAEFCTAVGEGQQVSGFQADRWNGHRWKTQQMPSPPFAYYELPQSVSCGSTRACVAVGYRNVQTTFDCPPNPMIPGCETDVPIVERWNGHRWALQSVPLPRMVAPALPRASNGPDVTLDSVSCSASNACMAVGDWSDPSLGVSTAQLFAERWDGRTWKLLTPPATSASEEAVSCPSATACMVLSDGPRTNSLKSGALFLLWNGHRWKAERPVIPAGTTNVALTNLSCPTARSCTAVGFRADRRIPSQPLIERWDGRRWRLEASPAPPHSTRQGGTSLSSVSCATATQCVAVGGYLNQSGDLHGWFIEQYSAP